jgi:hypothetical protein
MQSLHEAAATIQFDTEAFDAVSDRAYAALGACDGRFAKAVALARSGAVRLLPDGQACVQSQEEDGQGYTVNGSCPCPDAQCRADNGHCKHVIASWLVRKMAQAMQAGPSRPPGGLSASFPEAPASANVHLLIEGRQVQLTVRDTDEERLLQRLRAILTQYPRPEKAKASSPPAPPPEGWCVVHQVVMRENHKDGRTWWSHPLPEGGWCKGKQPKGQGR